MKQLLRKLAEGSSLSEEQTFEIFEALLADSQTKISDAQLGAYLFATASRLPAEEELIGAARALRRHMLPVALSDVEGADALLDTCGTGGSGRDAFNTSTAAAFVCAAAGCKVAKHGARAASGRCGSADVLEALGITIDLGPEEARRCLVP